MRYANTKNLIVTRYCRGRNAVVLSFCLRYAFVLPSLLGLIDERTRNGPETDLERTYNGLTTELHLRELKAHAESR